MPYLIDVVVTLVPQNNSEQSEKDLKTLLAYGFKGFFMSVGIRVNSLKANKNVVTFAVTVKVRLNHQVLQPQEKPYR